MVFTITTHCEHNPFASICSLFALRRFVSSCPIFVTTSYIAVHCELDYTDVVSFYSVSYDHSMYMPTKVAYDTRYIEYRSK